MEKCYVLHVKEGYEDRKVHIEKELARKQIPFEYMLDGDMCDLTQQRLDTYFKGRMYEVSGVTSCAMKHLLIYETMVRDNIDKALVIEDDVFLKSSFVKVFEESVRNTWQRHGNDEPYYVGYESTWTRLIPRSERRRQKGVVFPAAHLQCTGAYFINKAFAGAVLRWVAEHKCDQPIDEFLTTLSTKGVFSLYWSYPVIAEQGSHNGKMNSSLASTQGRSIKKVFARKITSLYKEILYYFR